MTLAGHIVAFDQVAGILLYRDNMHPRVVPLPVQSVLLFATLMFELEDGDRWTSATQ